MDCRRHDGREGIAVGAGTAALLLLIFAVIVAPLLAYPYVKLIGGLALIYIAIKFLVQRSAREEAVAAATNLSAVVRIVLTADIILGLDNVIALAGIARGNFALLVVGLAISLPIILAGAALFMKLLDRFPFLVRAGATLLGWVGGDIIANDSAVSRATAVFAKNTSNSRKPPQRALGRCWSSSRAQSDGACASQSLASIRPSGATA